MDILHTSSARPKKVRRQDVKGDAVARLQQTERRCILMHELANKSHAEWGRTRRTRHPALLLFLFVERVLDLHLFKINHVLAPAAFDHHVEPHASEQRDVVQAWLCEADLCASFRLRAR